MTTAPSVLVIDDEESICVAFSRFFENRGWRVRSVGSAREGLTAARDQKPSVIFLDVRLPDGDGLAILDQLSRSNENSSIVVITAFGTYETVLQAIRGRAFDYLAKPIDLDKALEIAQRAYHERGAIASPAAIVDVNSQPLIGRSASMQQVFKLIARMGPSPAPVLIDGETGAGKELVGRALHACGPRSQAPFVAVNCGAIPPELVESELFGHVRGAFTGADADRVGRFEAANGGTLFLDEIGDLPMAAQVKLLRAMDDHVIERVGTSRPIRLDLRIITATNKNLASEVAAGKFRSDLFYRIAVLRIHVPALRDRREDIPQLCEHFLLQRSNGIAPYALSNDAIQTFMNYAWPGNVRELRSAIEHALAVAPGRLIERSDLPEAVRTIAPTDSMSDALARAAVEFAARSNEKGESRHNATLNVVEQALISYALLVSNGNQTAAADYLGIHRNTLRTKLARDEVSDS